LKKAGYIFNFAEIVGGGELSLLDLAGEIRALEVQPIGFVPGPGEVRRRLEAMKVPVHETPWPPIRLGSLASLPGRQKRLAELFRNEALDLVHVNGARCMLYAGPAARRAGIPCVWHVRVLERDRLLDRFRARCASAVIANSEAAAATIRPLLPGSVKCKVIYNGLRLEEIASTPPGDLKAQFGLGGAPVILAAGRFSRSKGFDDLIKACHILKGKGIAFACLLAGQSTPEEADCEADLKKLARGLGLDNVVFAGWRDDIPALMKASSALALPSHVEAFGRVIPEAWACGLPVVAAAAAGPAELIKDGSDGLLARVGDAEEMARALATILQDKALAARLAAAGRARAPDFSLQNHARMINDVYKAL